jgi:hypothetical protein
MSDFNLNKQIFSKRAFNDTIDTSFTELTSSVELPITQSLPTINEFFQYYNDLFYDIPKFGDENSHEYLVLTSQQYIGTISSDQDVIDALIAEVTELREENLALQQEIAISATSTAEEALNRLKEING